MYFTRNVSKTILQQKPNLKVSTRSPSTGTSSFWIKHCFLFSSTVRSSIRSLINDQYVLRTLKDRIFLRKTDTRKLVRVWTHQCECVFAQRVRRGQQMFSLYSKLWEEHALKAFINRMKQNLSRRSKELFLSAAGVSAYNWDAMRIPDEEMTGHMSELEYGRFLKEKTIMCDICSQDQSKIDSKKIVFCDCPGRDHNMKTWENWTIFIEREDMIVWRKPHPGRGYEYKVYGSYNDVTAEDFLNVQIDTEYRRKWDSTAVELNLIDTDPQEGSNSDIIYWEMLWPKLFSNRDYVFNRRYSIDHTNNTMLVLNKTTEHPNCPQKSDKFRIHDYWSSMVIKPYRGFRDLGVEYSLTYFDNPGISIPDYITDWVAYRVMPDFLSNLRLAAMDYVNYCRDHKCRGLYSVDDDLQPNTTMPVFTETEDDCDWAEIYEAEENMFDAIMAKLDRAGRQTEEIADKQIELIKERALKIIDLTPLGRYNLSKPNDVIDNKNGDEDIAGSTELQETQHINQIRDDSIIESAADAVHNFGELQNQPIVSNNESCQDVKSTTNSTEEAITVDQQTVKELDKPTKRKVTDRFAGPSLSPPGIELMTSPSPMMQADITSNTTSGTTQQGSGYWKYLHPTYYFS